MPEMEPIKSAPKPQSTPPRPQSAQTRRSSAGSRPDISRVFTTGHLDDISTYHGGDHDARPEDESEDSEYSEEAREEDDEAAAAAGEDEVDVVQMGIRATRDLESGAGLEKNQTSKSLRSTKTARDPNLVSRRSANTYSPSSEGTKTSKGLVERSRRPREPQELGLETQVGCHCHHQRLHFHLARLFVNGSVFSHAKFCYLLLFYWVLRLAAGPEALYYFILIFLRNYMLTPKRYSCSRPLYHRCGIWYHKPSRIATCPFDLCPDIRCRGKYGLAHNSLPSAAGSTVTRYGHEAQSLPSPLPLWFSTLHQNRARRKCADSAITTALVSWASFRDLWSRSCPAACQPTLSSLQHRLRCLQKQGRDDSLPLSLWSWRIGSTALGGGVLSDCFRADERGRAISIYSLAPLLGPAVGPIAGGFITQHTSRRWAFYATSIADAIVQIAGLFFLRETYPPKLLHLKAEKLRKETGNTALHTVYEHPERSLAKTMERSIVRPFRLLGTQPIVQVLALYMAYLYGLMYLVLSTFPSLWERQYHESIGIGGLVGTFVQRFKKDH